MENILDKENSKNEPKAAPQSRPSADPQKGSPIFQLLPQELRSQIYSQVFSSTRLSCGKINLDRMEGARIVPSPNSLALLRTCRRTRDEIGDTWLAEVLFSFGEPETMLDKLSALSPKTLCKIRQLRVSCEIRVPSYPYDDDDVHYRLVAMLALLPGLRVDTLTVFGIKSSHLSYDTLNCLVKESCGWKELRYVCHSSEMLAYAEHPMYHALGFGDRYLRRPQPSYWQNLMEDRDGPESQPSILIYRSTAPDCPGSVFNPKTRVLFQQAIPTSEQEKREFGTTEDSSLISSGEIGNELLVVVKRGTGVDYEQKKGPPFIEDDIRLAMPDKPWKEIRYEYIDCIYERHDGDDSLSSDDKYEEPVIVDTYDDVDTYVWPLHYFKREL